ncbi:ubiquitin-protein ligase [Lithospermum erythrorhizon]|uniref:RING-type E3 ubiquitin transferase n=1 Tax=Lithospermum erythrorhizon TaxID=34254 RepID=A0AAV3Q884_LITER
MSQQFDVSTRRILTFPAIRPSEFVSCHSLVSSLIHLGDTISAYTSKTFVTNKKNARNCIRLVDDVVLFLEELRNEQFGLESSIILSLSGLHFAFQKIHCTRGDAKVFMLVKAEEVSGLFRELMRAIGVALDVIPLGEMDVSVEVQNLVEFVKIQSLKGKCILELDDEKIARKVFSALNLFEGSEYAPEPSDFRLVLEYLGIGSWSECNRELDGFMIYCRCSLFDVVDRFSTLQSVDECRNEIFRCLNPEDFRCPISLELMTDPVTLSTWHTYDRSSILKWFAAGNHTCPKTSESLVCIDLVPNVALKKIIKQYCLQNGMPFTESGGFEREKVYRKVDVYGVAAQQAVRLISNYLVGRLLVERNEMQNKMVYEMRLLTKTSVFNRSCLVELSAISPLLILLSSVESSTRENAMATLLNLSKFHGSKKEIVESGRLILILDVSQEGYRYKQDNTRLARCST